MFHATCHIHEVETDQPALFVAHMRDEHKKRPMTVWGIEAIRRMWRTPRRRPFQPAEFGPGVWVVWGEGVHARSGQVWAFHPNSRLRWVVTSDQLAHDVEVSRLRRCFTNEWVGAGEAA